MQEWWDFLEQKINAGLTIQRVRLVRKPLTEYLVWELEVYKETTKHGEEIGLLSENKLTPDIEELGDFWVIDDSMVLKMKYDEKGRYEDFRLIKDLKPYLVAKSYLLTNSTSL